MLGISEKDNADHSTLVSMRQLLGPMTQSHGYDSPAHKAAIDLISN